MRRSFRSSAFAALALVLSTALTASPTALSAQSAGTAPATTADSAPRPRVCFRGRPLPRCRGFFLTEVSYVRRVAGTSHVESVADVRPTLRDLDSHFSAELGYMVNHDRTATGGTLMIGTGDAGVRFAAKARHRLWLRDNTASLDLSGGVLTAGVRSGLQPRVDRGVGLTADATFGVGDFVGVTARAELLRADRRNATALYGGVRLGTYPAIGASVLGGIGLTLLIIALSRGDF